MTSGFPLPTIKFNSISLSTLNGFSCECNEAASNVSLIVLLCNFIT